MKTMLKRLEDEACLSRKQAIKSVLIIKDTMDKEGIQIDWNKFFKGKLETYRESVRETINCIAIENAGYKSVIITEEEESEK